MKLEKGRSDWLAAIDVKWLSADYGGRRIAEAPYLYVRFHECPMTLLAYRLVLVEDFPYPEFARSIPVGEVKVAEQGDVLPWSLREGLRRLNVAECITPWIKLVEGNPGRVTAIDVETWARDRIRDADAWRDKIVRILLGERSPVK